MTQSLNKLIEELEKFPGIGRKTAERLAFYILKSSSEDATNLTKAIIDVKEKIKYCGICNNVTEDNVCFICRDTRRDNTTICVVENPKDVIVIEKTHEYKGLYHVLMGSISPLDGIGPDELKIEGLLKRLSNQPKAGQPQTDKVREIIIATNPNVEGEATSMYLAKVIKQFGIKITRIAYGLPVGGDLEYADEVTLSRAFEGRREL